MARSASKRHLTAARIAELELEAAALREQVTALQAASTPGAVEGSARRSLAAVAEALDCDVKHHDCEAVLATRTANAIHKRAGELLDRSELVTELEGLLVKVAEALGVETGAGFGAPSARDALGVELQDEARRLREQPNTGDDMREFAEALEIELGSARPIERLGDAFRRLGIGVGEREPAELASLLVRALDC